MGRHLHPGAGQPPEHLLRATALPQQLRVPPAGPAQKTPAERREWAVGRVRERQTDRQGYGESEREDGQVEDDKEITERDGKEMGWGERETDRQKDKQT